MNGPSPGTGDSEDDLLMLQRVSILLEDDLDGSAADETLTFRLDGASYEIDLTNKHAEQLRSALSPWISPARQLGGRRPAGRAVQGTGPARSDHEQLDAIRQWARRNGHSINDRGRIPAAIRDAFDAAHHS